MSVCALTSGFSSEVHGLCTVSACGTSSSSSNSNSGSGSSSGNCNGRMNNSRSISSNVVDKGSNDGSNSNRDKFVTYNTSHSSNNNINSNNNNSNNNNNNNNNKSRFLTRRGGEDTDGTWGSETQMSRNIKLRSAIYRQVLHYKALDSGVKCCLSNNN